MAISQDQIEKLATLAPEDIRSIVTTLLPHLDWSDVGGQGAYAVALGDMTLITYNHTQNYGTPVKSNGKSSKYPRVATSGGFKGITGATLGVTFSLNVIDTALLTTQVGESVGTEE
jgi:hypothetical protein